MQIELFDKSVLLSLRWHTASAKKTLQADAWLERYSADRAIYLTSEKKVSIGVVENTSHDDSLVPRKAYSLAAMFASRYENAVIILEFPTSDGSLYWGCIISNGVPEMDYASATIDLVMAPIASRLDDSIAKLLSVPTPTMVIQHKLEPGISSYWDEVKELRSWRLESISLDEIGDMLSSNSTLHSSIIRGSSSNLLEEIKALPKETIKNIIYIFLIIIIGYFGLDMLGVIGEKTKDTFENYAPQKPAEEIQADLKPVYENAIRLAMSKEMIGANNEWVFAMRSRFADSSNFVSGYTKQSITCSMTTRDCSMIYKAEGTFSNLIDAVETFSKDTRNKVLFDVKGQIIRVVYPIPTNLFATRPILITDLPPFDLGIQLINGAVNLSKERPGLVVAVNAASMVEVSPEDKSLSMKLSPVEYKYVIAGWSADGTYLHQMDVVINTIQNNFLTTNTLKITRNSGEYSFVLNGGYLMQSPKDGVLE